LIGGNALKRVGAKFGLWWKVYDKRDTHPYFLRNGDLGALPHLTQLKNIYTKAKGMDIRGSYGGISAVYSGTKEYSFEKNGNWY
jgi:hypothetical protein